LDYFYTIQLWKDASAMLSTNFPTPKFKFFSVTNGFSMFVSTLTVRSRSNKVAIAGMFMIHLIKIHGELSLSLPPLQNLSQNDEEFVEMDLDFGDAKKIPTIF
jgi:hypothetical protein